MPPKYQLQNHLVAIPLQFKLFYLLYSVMTVELHQMQFSHYEIYVSVWQFLHSNNCKLTPNTYVVVKKETGQKEDKGT